jgi:SAM-dependent methyltransferase
VDFQDIYSDYPVNKRRLDMFSRGTLGNLLSRLVQNGLKKTDAILDYGCGNGIFVEFLKEQGFRNAIGYDPFVPQFASIAPGSQFDALVANDVIEHVPDPRAMIAACDRLTKPGGLLYIGTADSEPVEMKDLEPHIMRLHQPFHRIILTQSGLLKLATESGLQLVKGYRRSYMDTWRPFSNYRFLDEFNKALGHNMDLAFDPSAAQVIVRKPLLLFYAFFGYLIPSAYEPAVVLRKPAI